MHCTDFSIIKKHSLYISVNPKIAHHKKFKVQQAGEQRKCLKFRPDKARPKILRHPDERLPKKRSEDEITLWRGRGYQLRRRRRGVGVISEPRPRRFSLLLSLSLVPPTGEQQLHHPGELYDSPRGWWWGAIPPTMLACLLPSSDHRFCGCLFSPSLVWSSGLCLSLAGSITMSLSWGKGSEALIELSWASFFWLEFVGIWRKRWDFLSLPF